MTVTVTSIVAGPFTLTGGSDVLPFTFLAITADEVEVYTRAGDIETIIAPADYTVTLNTEPSGVHAEGGSVTVTGKTGTAYVRANPLRTQEVVWNNQGSRLVNLNENLDRATMVALRQQYDTEKLVLGEVTPGVIDAAVQAAFEPLADGKLDVTAGNIGDAAAKTAFRTAVGAASTADIAGKANTDLVNATFLPEGSAALARAVNEKIALSRSIGDRMGADSDARLRAALAANATDDWAELLGENEPIFILTDLEIPDGQSLIGKGRSPGERYGEGDFADEKNLIVLSPGASISYCPQRSSLSGFTIITRALYDALPWANEATALAGIAGFAGTAIKLLGQTRPGTDEAFGTAVLGSGGTAGQVVSVTITDMGANYDSYAFVRFVGGGATTPATGTVTLTGGQVTGITITSPGSGYSTPPTVIIYVGGADCVLQNLLILGFSQAVDAQDIDRLRCVDVKGDCTNGIHTMNSFDVSDFVRCRFWPFTSVHIPEYGVSWELTKREGTAFLCDGVGDWTNFTDCFSFGYDVGTDINGPSHVLCHNSSHDGASSLVIAGRVTYGFRIRGADTRNITLSMCRAAGQAYALNIDMSGTVNPICTTIGFRSWGTVLSHCKFDRGIWNDVGSQWEPVTGFEIGNNFTIADTITSANLQLTYPSNPAIAASATAMAKMVIVVGGIGSSSTTAQTDHRSGVAATENFTGVAGGYWTQSFRMANGTAAAPTDSIVSNVLGVDKWQGYAAGAFRNTASVRATVSYLSGSDIRSRLAVWQAASGVEAEHTAFKPAGGVVFPRLAADPTGEQGEVYENTTTDKLRRHDGTSWSDLGAASPPVTRVIAYPANATPGLAATGTIVWANAVENVSTQLNVATGAFQATQDCYLLVSAILAVTPADATLGRLNIIALKNSIEFSRDQRVVATTNTVNLSICTWIRVEPGDVITFSYFNDRATTWVGEAGGVPISTLRILGIRLV